VSELCTRSELKKIMWISTSMYTVQAKRKKGFHQEETK